MADTVTGSQGHVPQIILRGPSSHTLKGAAPPSNTETIAPPKFDWLSGTWNVLYSSLPLWKGKQNVRITYQGINVEPGVSGERMPDFDDHVEYQKIGSSKTSSVHGVSRPVHVEGVGHGLAYHWR